VLYLIGCRRDEGALVTTPAAAPPTSGSNAKHGPKCAADQPYKQSASEPLKPANRLGVVHHERDADADGAAESETGNGADQS
jgi:hypothetical protein